MPYWKYFMFQIRRQIAYKEKLLVKMYIENIPTMYIHTYIHKEVYWRNVFYSTSIEILSFLQRLFFPKQLLKGREAFSYSGTSFISANMVQLSK